MIAYGAGTYAGVMIVVTGDIADVPTAAANAAAVRAELATELARVDVAVSTRNATAPDNAGIAAIKAKTDTLVNGPTLAEIEASALAKDATVTAAQTAIVSEIASSEASIVAEIAAIPAPDNASITAIKAKTDVLVNGPTLAEIEASTLAKDATVTAAQTAIVSEIAAIPAPDVPTASENAAATISAMNATPPHVNVREVNNRRIYGNGVFPGDVFRTTE